ncbi:MAG: type III-B CRISPR-associated protein Cas10/Cmr2 [Thermofilum sp.]|uniref:type III-B CRISPR-associated protein Cas10/Cmr2 n=1 Tax=Thermofilum sp. TaxID=1961369 RepID=UPI00316F45D0
MRPNELFQLKAAALFHDPPNKAWLIVKRRAHEEEAGRLSEILLKGTILENALTKLTASEVRNADHLASGVERWLLSILGGEKEGAFYYGEIVLKNCFDPRISIKLNNEPRNVEDFFEYFHKIISGVKDPKIAWHLLYFLYEMLWAERGFASGPADTRIPTHSIFDHCYTTAALTNWYLKSVEPKGMLIAIDIAGVQSFISEARKLKDFWAASYMVSSLMWSILWIFVEKLGPDVLIKPTCRDNPFYCHSLFSMLRSNGVEFDFISIGKLCKKFTGYDPQEDVYPPFAVIPEKATLILPDFDILSELFGESFKNDEDLRRFVESRYRENWKQIYETIIENTRSDESLKEFREIARLLEDWKKYGFDKTPPLSIRVVSVTVDEVKALANQGLEPYELYDRMNRELGDRLRRQTELKFRPEIELKLTELTESEQGLGWPKSSNRIYDYCTVCGRLPAMLLMPMEELEGARFIEAYFSPGERLCPYCLIKRLFANYADELLGKLLGKKISKGIFRPVFPSVSDIASIEFKESILKGIEEKSDKDLQAVLEILTRLEKLTGSARNMVSRISTQETWWSAQRDLAEKIESLIDTYQYRDKVVPLYLLVYGSAESLYFREESEKLKWRSFVKDSFEKDFPLRPYYALIKSDADNMGKLIFGEVEKALNINIDEYLKGLLEKDANEIVSKIVSSIKENNSQSSEYLKEAERILQKYIREGASEKIKKARDFLKRLIDSKQIFVTPAYHMLISRALMRTAARDIRIASSHKGVVIYTGGDDLFVLAPVSETLSIIYETRIDFSLGSGENPGFERIGGGDFYIPSLISIGRSYSVNIAHYMYPLYLAIGKTIDNLEMYAKHAKWDCEDTGFICRKKDALILCFSARGGREQTSLLPFLKKDSNVDNIRNLGECISMLIELVKDIEERKVFTTSLIYDFEMSRGLINELLRVNAPDMLRGVLTSVFNRNLVKEKESKISDYVCYLVNNRNLRASYNSANVYFLTEFLKGLQIIRNGLKGGS